MSFDHATSPCFHVHPVDAWNEPQTWVTWLWGGVTHLVGNEQLWYRARIRAVGVTLAGFFCQTKRATRIFQQKVQYGVRKMLIQSMIWYSCPFFLSFFHVFFSYDICVSISWFGKHNTQKVLKNTTLGVWNLIRPYFEYQFTRRTHERFASQRKISGTLGMVPLLLFNPLGSPLKGDTPNKYSLHKVYMGLIIKGTVPRVPPFSPWALFWTEAGELLCFTSARFSYLN